ncbi:hypothetical protein AB0M36_36430 [Actinoplanes sp. NPDC051346]|uniref:hypothetical protein n=1 Tax=Actinoplanes sp. NPDC051346 TaxID=3155048 RepID=UPI00342D5901
MRIWPIRVNELGPRKKSYTVRWKVAHNKPTKTFANRTLADNFRSELKSAFNNGQQFDVESGLPPSMLTTKDVTTWLELFGATSQ